MYAMTRQQGRPAFETPVHIAIRVPRELNGDLPSLRESLDDVRVNRLFALLRAPTFKGALVSIFLREISGEAT